MRTSWWLDLTREQFIARLPSEAERMANVKGATFYAHAWTEFREPARRRLTPYTYALEADRVEP